MSWLDWMMIGIGLIGGTFVAYGAACALRDRRAERAALKRSAAEWDGDEAPAGRAR